MDKEDVIHIHIDTRILLNHEKEKDLAICDSMGKPKGYYAK